VAKLRARRFNDLEMCHSTNVQCSAGQKGKIQPKAGGSERKIQAKITPLAPTFASLTI
jgi:hypothetical protein